MPVNFNRAGCYVIKTGNQIDESGFAAAGVSDQGQRRSRFYRQINVFEYRRTGIVFKRNIFENNVFGNLFQFEGFRLVFNIRFKSQNIRDALDCKKRYLNRAKVFADILNRVVKHNQCGYERNEVTAGDAAVNNQIAAIANNGTDTDRNDDVKHGRHPGCLLNHFNAQLKKFAQSFIIFGKNPLLEVIGGNGLVAGISFVVVCENGRVFLHGFVNNVLNHPTHLSQRQQSKTKHDDGDDGSCQEL